MCCHLPDRNVYNYEGDDDNDDDDDDKRSKLNAAEYKLVTFDLEVWPYCFLNKKTACNFKKSTGEIWLHFCMVSWFAMRDGRFSDNSCRLPFGDSLIFNNLFRFADLPILQKYFIWLSIK